eukprot:jgi/Tetstr1/460378/TSEL_005677.t1
MAQSCPGWNTPQRGLAPDLALTSNSSWQYTHVSGSSAPSDTFSGGGARARGRRSGALRRAGLAAGRPPRPREPSSGGRAPRRRRRRGTARHKALARQARDAQKQGRQRALVTPGAAAAFALAPQRAPPAGALAGARKVGGVDGGRGIRGVEPPPESLGMAREALLSSSPQMARTAAASMPRPLMSAC